MSRQRKQGRGRLSYMKMMPREAAHIVAWAKMELADEMRPQVEIYEDFKKKCQELIEESGGEITFDIPSFSAFNRASIRQAELLRRMTESRDLANVLAEMYDAEASDKMTIMLAEALKSMAMELQADGKLTPKQLLEVSGALRNLIQAQRISAEARQRQQAEIDAKLSSAVETVAQARGITKETAEAIKAQILGVAA